LLSDRSLFVGGPSKGMPLSKAVFGFLIGIAFLGYLSSDAFKRAQETGRLTAGGFATDPCASLFQRVMAIFSPERPDNCNVSVNALAHQAVEVCVLDRPALMVG
jgi:hypothetical protein